MHCPEVLVPTSLAWIVERVPLVLCFCDWRYGKVCNCVVLEFPDAAAEQAVRIFLEFEDTQAATKAYTDMNGRYFGGRVVQVRYFDEGKYKNDKHRLGVM